MKGNRAAIRYAKAMLDVATSKNVANEVNADMLSIATTINNNNELSAFIENPTISVEVKEKALLEVFASTNQVSKGLFHLLFVNKRFEILSEIASQYNKLFDETNGVEQATVTTAFPITEELEKQVLAKVATFSNKRVSLKNIVDELIIGGFILRIGDQQYNASVANRLQELKRQFSN